MDDIFFVQNSLIEVNIPEDPNLNIEEALSASDLEVEENVSSLVPGIPQRNILYFDETFQVLLVIRVPHEDEAVLKSRISRLAVTTEAHAVSDPPQPAQPSANDAESPQRDVIWSSKLDVFEEPIVVVEESTEEDDVATTLLIWKLTVTLGRPRMKLQSPAVSWKVFGSLEAAPKRRMGDEDIYLPRGVPLPANLLEPLRDEPTLEGRTPYLSASRLTSARKRLTLTPALPLQVLRQRPTRALPAFGSRIRFHRSHKLGDVPTITASLELEFSPYAPVEVDVLSVKLNLARGQIDQMAPDYSVQLPKTCRGRDCIVWLYTLSPQKFSQDIGNTSLIHALEVEIEACAHVSDICKSRIKVKWRTNVDFSTAANTVKRSLNPTLNQTGRPKSDMYTGSIAERLSPLSSVEASLHDTGDPEFTMTFVPKTQTIYVGEPFAWEVIVVNRSPTTRQLVLTALQKRKRQSQKQRHSHQSSTGSVTAVSKSGIVADAVIDENLLYATVKMSGPEPANLIPLSADVRVEPLGPGAATQVEMQLLPMVAGWLQLEAVRVTDVVMNEFVDLKQLPDVFAVERKKEGEEEGVNAG